MTSKSVSVVVRYFRPGTRPPMYLAGSFSFPEWQPQEMEYHDEGSELEFSKKVEVELGKQYQYKFRIGPGDWWAINEESPTGKSATLFARRMRSSFHSHYFHELALALLGPD